ncbi:MerR family transcriptional regulator [Actinokineospora sp. PR83]|uniref:MerR family transcriptional regulator n=1 Tax=Actinokineospora sp. PR83 TaxID=2884908 RepID=UPI001F284E10|nr:MerR family transcriptional regulator [Actinokineospora sp. PR83]MCG8914468.1 MerR family transcriptional regulator [Actinokineospora sp. PR83]
MRIGDLSARTGVSIRSLRYYEERGLLTSTRTTGAQRLYTEDSVDRVRLLRRLFDAGLSSETIAALLPCVDTPAEDVTAQTLEVMRSERERIDAQIATLLTTRDHLDALMAGAAGHLARQREDALAAAG